MPVPESDGNFAIHTIPTTLKENKSGNTVKFSQVDSYHEYRSRHKHTPPTKDTASYDKPKRVSAVVIEQTEQELFNSLSDSSLEETSNDDSYLNNIKLKSKKERNDRLSDAERIIIYKILDSKADKKWKTCKNKHLECSKKTADTLNSKDATEAVVENNISTNATRKLKNKSFDQLDEGNLFHRNRIII